MQTCTELAGDRLHNLTKIALEHVQFIENVEKVSEHSQLAMRSSKIFITNAYFNLKCHCGRTDLYCCCISLWKN